MKNYKENHRVEENFRISTTIYLLLGLILIICSLVNFEEENSTYGIYYLVGGVLAIGTSIWAIYQLFFPELIGFLIFTFFLIIIYYYLSDYIFSNRSSLKVLSIIIIGYLCSISSLVVSFKKWRNQRKVK